MATWTGNGGNNNYDFQEHPPSGNDRGYGRGGHDKIWGWNGHDKLYGQNGRDWLYGERGNDWLYGGDDSDHAYGGHGSDHVYGGDGRDYVYGGDDRDYVYGQDGNDYVYGQGGHDHVYGGDGKDHIWGGSGGDRYYFDWSHTGGTKNSADVIHDFKNEDTIHLKGRYSLYEGSDHKPGDGQYDIYKEGNDWVVKYNRHDGPDNYHYIVVKGHDPHGDIAWF